MKILNRILNILTRVVAVSCFLTGSVIIAAVLIRQHELNKIYNAQKRQAQQIAARPIMTQATGIESDVRSQVVVITRRGVGLCSGEQVIAPSGKSYIMTAGHCGVLMDNQNNIRLKTADGVRHTARLIKADPYNDVLVFTGVSTHGLKIASKIFATEHIFSETRGLGFPTYRTDGNIIMLDSKIDIPLDPIVTDQDQQNCLAKPDQTVENSLFGAVCVAHWHETMTTAFVAPGSSGGPMVNKDGELVGIVSISEAGMFSGLVQLNAIQDLLRDM